ncbi:MAG TPA: AAA family ATPase [Terriglobales bacterium]|nr:AAA family ATPase [Terriglobales bacterium]
MITLKIKGLFDMNDVTLEIGERCVILLGENGLGKSTMLRLLRDLLAGDFCEMTRFPFAKATLRAGNQRVDIRYEDLFPERDAFLRYAVRESGMSLAVGEAMKSTGLPVPAGDAADEGWRDYLSAMLAGVDTAEYCSRLACVYWGDDEGLRLFSDEEQERNSKRLRQCLIDLEHSGSFLLSPIARRNRAGAVTLKLSQLMGLNSSDLSLAYGTALYSGLVRAVRFCGSDGIELDNSFLPAYQPRNAELDMDMYGNRLHTLANYVGHCAVDQDVHQLKEAYGHLARATRRSRAIAEDIFARLDDDALPVGAIIADHYYTETDIVSVNTRAASYFLDAIGTERVCGLTDAGEFWAFIEQNRDFLEDYVMPALIKDSIFDTYLREVFSCEADEGGCDQVGDALKRFVEGERDYILSLKPDRIRRFEGELARFMFNKQVSVTPRGLRLGDRKGRGISPMNLSSGEHNLICMLTYAFFFDDCALLIDEPELSLSIVWQSWLLPAILRHTKAGCIIVATHSPYIAEDESVQDYISPLGIKEI